MRPRIGVQTSDFLIPPAPSRPAPREKLGCSRLDFVRLFAALPLGPLRGFAASREPPLRPSSFKIHNFKISRPLLLRSGPALAPLRVNPSPIPNPAPICAHSNPICGQNLRLPPLHL